MLSCWGVVDSFDRFRLCVVRGATAQQSQRSVLLPARREPHDHDSAGNRPRNIPSSATHAAGTAVNASPRI